MRLQNCIPAHRHGIFIQRTVTQTQRMQSQWRWWWVCVWFMCDGRSSWFLVDAIATNVDDDDDDDVGCRSVVRLFYYVYVIRVHTAILLCRMEFSKHYNIYSHSQSFPDTHSIKAKAYESTSFKYPSHIAHTYIRKWKVYMHTHLSLFCTFYMTIVTFSVCFIEETPQTHRINYHIENTTSFQSIYQNSIRTKKEIHFMCNSCSSA